MEPSNELTPAVIFTHEPLTIQYFPSGESFLVRYIPSDEISLFLQPFVPDLKLVGIGSIGTPIPETTTLKVLSLHKDQIIAGIKIKSVMLVQLRYVPEGVLVETWLEGAYEYGVADSDIGAIEDLVISLNEYLSILINNKESLGDSAKKELNTLQRVIGSDTADKSGGP
jgi:hypothetical protein